MVIFCEGCDVHMFLKIEAVAFLSQKGCQILKIKWIFELAYMFGQY